MTKKVEFENDDFLKENKYEKENVIDKDFKKEANEKLNRKKSLQYSPHINSFAHTTYNISPRSENYFHLNQKSIDKQNKINTPQNNKSLDTDLRNKISHNR